MGILDYFRKPDVSKVDEEITLGDQRCIRAYIIVAEKVDIDYTRGPDAHIPYPTDAVQYARFASKVLVEPSDNKDREERKHAAVVLNQLKKRDFGNDKKAKSYLQDYCDCIEHNGQRIADKITDARGRLDDIEKERNTFWGKGKQMGDVVFFRLGSGLGVYGLLDGPLGDVSFNLFGHEVRCRDIAVLAGSTAFGINSGISYSWGKRKERNLMRELRDKLDAVYRQTISDSIEKLRRYYPQTLVPIDEEVLARRKAAELRKKYTSRAG